MAPRILDGWESPRPSQNPEGKWEYYRIIGQIDLKIRTDEDLTEFEGFIIDKLGGAWQSISMHIFCDQEGWRSLIPDVTPEGNNYPSPGPKIPMFNNMEELAAFMVAKAEEIEAGRSA